MAKSLFTPLALVGVAALAFACSDRSPPTAVAKNQALAPMEELKTAIALTALLVSAASFFVAQRSAARAKKAAAIKELLGEKETVAFAALSLLRDGLPRNDAERALVLAAVMQACVFEGSDRARALLYRVLDENRAKYGTELSAALASIKDTFASMDKFQFRPEDLDLERGRRRLAAVEKVLPNTALQQTPQTR